MRIVHFSDIHAGTWFRSLRGYADKRLFGALNFRLRRSWRQDWSLVPRAVAVIRRLQPDCVICTGDLASVSEPREFEQALAALAPLVAEAGIEFVYVPGNHDCYVNDRKCRAALEQAFATLNRGRWTLGDLPLVHHYGEIRFLLVNQAVPRHWLSSAGDIDRPARAWLQRYFSGADGDAGMRIAVSHFPLLTADGAPLSWRRRCYHTEVLLQAFRAGRIEIALCGHIHQPFARRGPGEGMEYCAGSLTSAGLLNIVEIGPGGQGHTQQWLDLRAEDEAVDAAVQRLLAVDEL